MERCEECAHYKVCKEVNDLKCRDQIIWYDAKSGCPYYSADVVPRSEVDRHREAELNAQRIIELEAEKDNLIKNYAECMREYAREIFADIEFEIHQLVFDRDETRAIAIEGIIANAKKKYTEGKQ